MDTVPLHLVTASLGNDRTSWDTDALQAFADGTRATRDLVPPIMVRPLPDGSYQLVAGERRTRSQRILFAEYEALRFLCQLAAVDCEPNPYASIRAEIKHDMSDETALAVMLAENEQRVDLDPVEQGRAYQRRLDAGWTIEQLVTVSGRTRPYIERRLAVTRLRPDLVHMVSKGQLPITYAELIASAELDTNRQLIAIRNLNKCTVKSVEVLRDICDQLRQQQAAEATADMFADQLITPGVQTRQEFKQTLPAIPGKQTAPIKGATFHEVAENQIKFWSAAAEQWDRFGKPTYRDQCAAAADAVRGVLGIMPKHSGRGKRVTSKDNQTLFVYAS